MSPSHCRLAMLQLSRREGGLVRWHKNTGGLSRLYTCMYSYITRLLAYAQTQPCMAAVSAQEVRSISYVPECSRS
jgi:hypothetical protein